MHSTDLFILLAFLVVVLVAGYRNRTKSEEENHFGSKKAHWWEIAFSIVATEASGLTFIAVPAFSYAFDNSFWNIYIGTLIARPFIAFFFLKPFYEIMQKKKHGVTTYGFIAERLGETNGKVSMFGFIVMRFLASGVRLYVASLLVQQITGFSLSLCLVLFLAVAILYCYWGGINAVIKTDVIQFLFFILSGVAIYSWFAQEGAFSLPIPSEKFSFFNMSFSLQNSFTIPAALLSVSIFDLATHGADFDLFQRLLAGKSLRQARVGVITSSILSMLVGALFLAIGLAFYGYVQAKGITDLPNNSQEAYTYALAHYLPSGVRGLVLAGLLAASLSSLDSALTAIETVWKKDIGTRIPWLNLSRLKVFLVSALFFFTVAYASQFSPNVLILGLKVQSYVIVPILGLLMGSLFHWGRDQKAHLYAFFISMVTQLYLVLGEIIGWAWGPLFTIATYAIVYQVASRARIVKPS